MPDIRYQPDHKGIAALMVTPEMHHLMGRAVEAAKEYAVSISPDQEPYAVGYIASFETAHGMVETIAGSSRATGTLTNTADHAAAVEYRWEHHVLGRTVDYLENAWFPHG